MMREYGLDGVILSSGELEHDVCVCVCMSALRPDPFMGASFVFVVVISFCH